MCTSFQMAVMPNNYYDKCGRAKNLSGPKIKMIYMFQI